MSLKRVRERVDSPRVWKARERQEIRSVNYELTITTKEARMGAKKVLTRGGGNIEVTIPRGVTNGSVLRLTDALQGTDNSYGDILVTIIIKD